MNSSNVEIPYKYNNILVVNIKKYAFSNCVDLKSITIPDSITRIERGAFNCCSNLEKIIIPKSVISISQNAFKGCKKLKILTRLRDKPKNWSEYWNPDNRPVVWDDTSEFIYRIIKSL